MAKKNVLEKWFRAAPDKYQKSLSNMTVSIHPCVRLSLIAASPILPLYQVFS